VRFEIMRLDDVDGNAVDSTVVDAASVTRMVQQAAAIGQRIYIRPAGTTAS
jgi:ssDNA-binding replication factor A large subunit